MKFKGLLCCGAAMMSMATVADATTINLIDNGFAGTAAQQAQFRAGFQIAAAYWGAILTNNVTINLGVGTASLGTGIIGSTGSTRADYSVANWETRVNATKSNSAIDSSIVLPTLTAGGASFITNGTTVGTDGFTDDDEASVRQCCDGQQQDSLSELVGDQGNRWLCFGRELWVG